MRFSLFLCLMFLTGISNATNYYVDPSSVASAQNGTLTEPWKTMSQVQSHMNSFAPGDFIYFKKGETFTSTTTLNVTRSGNATAPITFATYGTSSLAPVFTTTAGDLFNIDSHDYVTFDGFKITDLTLDPNDRTRQSIIHRAFVIDGSTYVIVKNCDISLVGAGMNLVGNYCTMDHCTISNLRMIRNTQGGDDDYGAIPVVIDGSNNTITNNFFNGCWANSYDYLYDGGVIEMYGSANDNNKIMYNTAENCDGFMEIGYEDGGSTNNNMVAYNKIINCGELVYISTSGSFATAVSNLQFYNNVIVHTVNQLTMPGSMIGMSSSSSASNIVVLKNNIFWLTSGIDVAASGKFTGTQMVHQDNIYHLGTGSVLNFTAVSSELSTTAALFTNTTGSDPLTWDYTPLAGSPAIDFGQNLGLTKDFAGNTVPSVPNAGILESGGAAPPALTVTATAGIIKCNGNATTVTVTASGGTAPYTGTGTFTVGAGTYNYTVTDAAGTIKNTSVTVTQPSLIAANVTSGTIAVFGGSTTVTATATGGTSPYTYNIDGGAFQSAGTFSNILAGTHIVIVKDALGCSVSKSITITQPGMVSPLTVTSSHGTINCNGGTTTITISASGGTAPYTGTGTFTVSAGTYNYTVTDAAGVIKNTSVTITQPSAISASVAAPNVTSSTATTTATITASGGTPAYTYALDAGAYQSGNVFSNVAVGTHSVKVKDTKGCIYTGSFTVSVTASVFKLNLVYKTDVTCKGKGDGSIKVSASGGTMPYQYKKDNGAYTTNTLFINVHSGTHTITGKDATGATSSVTVTILPGSVICSGRTSARVEIKSGETEPEAISGVKITAYPNPSSTQFSLIVEGENKDDVHITVMNINGQKVYENTSAADKKNTFGSSFIPGVYFVKVVQGSNVQVVKLVKTN